MKLSVPLAVPVAVAVARTVALSPTRAVATVLARVIPTVITVVSTLWTDAVHHGAQHPRADTIEHFHGVRGAPPGRSFGPQDEQRHVAHRTQDAGVGHRNDRRGVDHDVVVL